MESNSSRIGVTRMVAAACAVLAFSVAGCAADATAIEDDADGIPADEEALGTTESAATNAFKCDGTTDVNQSGLGKGSGSLKRVRLAPHASAGFDRFVMELEASADPRAYIVRRQTSTRFENTCSPECPATRVEGEHAIAVIFQNSEGISQYRGPLSMKSAGLKGIKQAVQYDQFEGNVEWALGTQRNPCFRTWTLTSPPRLIVDVKR